MFRFKKLITAKIDMKKVRKGINTDNCHLEVNFPMGMPESEKRSIQQQLNGIVDDIRSYL